MTNTDTILHQSDVLAVINNAIDSRRLAAGVATLVAGTKTVADTHITANSQIRLTNKTLGGTPGAPYISAKVASTSFTITSTNAADTSTIAYEIIAY